MMNRELQCCGSFVSRRQFPLPDQTTSASQKRRYPCWFGWVLLVFVASAALADDIRLHFDPDHWQLTADGILQPRAGGGCAWTVRRYGDFVLDLEFKVEPRANSGVLIRVSEPGQYIEKGLEIQVLDNHGEPRLTKGSCGALYDLLEPAQNAVKPAGEWNRYRITCRGSMIQVELNDTKIIDADLDQWTEPGKNPDGTKNKFKLAGKDKPRAGFIGLQDHGDKVSYRNIRVKPLAPPVAPENAPAPKVVDGWEILFDGTDTAQWKLDPQAWVIRDDALCFLGRPEPAVTTATYGDCSVEFEFKPPKNGIGGVELRRDSPGRGGTGLLVALGDTPTCGALLDCIKPSAPVSVKVNEWNQCKIVCRGPVITVEINGQPVLRADLDQWTTKEQNPDGTKNRYRIPLRDWPRTGLVAFRAPLQYRNIRIERLP